MDGKQYQIAPHYVYCEFGSCAIEYRKLPYKCGQKYYDYWVSIYGW